MGTKDLVKVLRKWHISGDNACLYCPQCWGKYLAQFSREMHEAVRLDSRDGDVLWARRVPICEMCHRSAED